MLKYLPIEIDITGGLSDLDLIMTFVKQQPKPATLSVYRMLSGLAEHEKTLYLSYLREFIHWLSTDEGTKL